MPDATNRIDTVLAQSPPGLWPFLVAGDPNLATTEQLLLRLNDTSIRGVELGIPYSDSISDGPVIQAAFNRALRSGLHVSQIFDMVARIRPRFRHALLAMVSASIVYRFGADQFVSRAAQSGLDGLIIPDLSLEEAAPLAATIHAAGMRLSMLIAPTTPDDRRKKIAALAGGFIYYVSLQGITGQRTRLAGDLAAQVRQIKSKSNLPVLVGFGISTPPQVKDVCTFANGAIVGSAIVQHMAQYAGLPDLVESTARLIEALAAG